MVRVLRVALIVAGLALAALASGCIPEGSVSQAPSATPLPEESAPDDGGVLYGEAPVESAQLVYTADGPILLDVEGYLPDGCTEIDHVEQSRSGAVLSITIITQRPADAMCTQAIVPFMSEVELDTSGLAAGEYTVRVGDIRHTFTVDADGQVVKDAAASDATPSATLGPASGAAGATLVREANIESLDVLILESYPVQVRLQISGYYPDGCTRLGESTREVDGDRIIVTVHTQRPRDAMCTQALVPFTENISLETGDLEPGTYTLIVNGIEQSLTLP